MKIRKMNKKGDGIGWLGEHTFNIVIAVVCLLILIGVGYKVYAFFSDKSELDKASENLKLVKIKIDSIKSLGTGSEEAIVYFPQGWFLRSFSSNFPLGEGECLGKKSCLCACKNTNCDSSGSRVCYGFDFITEVISSPIIFEKSAEGLRIFKDIDIIKIEHIENIK